MRERDYHFTLSLSLSLSSFRIHFAGWKRVFVVRIVCMCVQDREEIKMCP